jgi:predicted alpha/beta hydrolase family esterase
MAASSNDDAYHLNGVDTGLFSSLASRYSFRAVEASYGPLEFQKNIVWVEVDGDVFPIYYCHNIASTEQDGCAAVFFHGNDCDIGDKMTFLSKMSVRCRCSFYCIEYPGYGNSTGVADERSVNARMLRGLKYISKYFNVPYGRMILVGHSIGAAVLLGVASPNPQTFGGVFLINTFSTLADIASDVMDKQFGVGLFGKLAGSAFDSETLISSLKTIPVYIYHCDGDEIIPVEHARRLYAAAPEGTRCLYIQPGGDHSNIEFKQLYLKFVSFIQMVQKRVKGRPVIRRPSIVTSVDVRGKITFSDTVRVASSSDF